MIVTMVDRLPSDIERDALRIGVGGNQSDPTTPRIVPFPSDVSYNIDTRLLPLFTSFVASAQTQSGRYNFNNSSEDILAAIHKLKSQNSFMFAGDSVAQVKLMNDVNQTTAPQDTNTESSSKEQSLQFLFASSTIKNKTNAKQLDSSQREVVADTSPTRKRSSSLSTSNHSSKKQKSIRNECIIPESTLPTFYVPLSDSERRESFPLPPKHPVSISKLPSLSKLWDDFEMISYNMDDTVADQQAFVKKLFVQSLHRSKLSHLKQRTQLASAKTMTQFKSKY